jgi:hypothetical protein
VPVEVLVAAATEPPPAPAAEPAAPALPPQPPAPPESPTTAPPTFESAERRLLDLLDRDDVARALLDFAASRSRRVLLFKVQRDEVSGWMAAGAGVDLERFGQFRVGLEKPSLFAMLQGGAPMVRGPLADLPAHADLRPALLPPHATDALAVPVRVRDRLVAVLYLEPREAPVPAADVSDLQRLVAKAAIAFEMCIMRAKLRRA